MVGLVSANTEGATPFSLFSLLRASFSTVVNVVCETNSNSARYDVRTREPEPLVITNDMPCD